MSARSIGEIAQVIVDKIAEISGLCGVNQFTMPSKSAMKKGGPEECDNTQPALTCNALQERRS